MILSLYADTVNDLGYPMTRQEKEAILVDTEKYLRSYIRDLLRVPAALLPETEPTADTDAMLPAPYDKLYTLSLEAEICRLAGELTRRELARQQFNRLLLALTLSIRINCPAEKGPDLKLF